MLEIDDSLYKSMSGVARQHYIDKKTAQFAETSPERYACAGEANVRAFIELTLAKSEKYNMPSDREINAIIALMQYLGCGFDADPQYPWAHLRDFGERKPYEKLENSESFQHLSAIFRNFHAFGKRTLGDDFEHIVSSYTKVTKLDFHSLVDTKNEDSLLSGLEKLYPEKFACVDKSVLRYEAFPEAENKATQYMLDSIVGKNICAGLIFFCGKDFDADPLFGALKKYLEADVMPGMRKEQELFSAVQKFAADTLHNLGKNKVNHVR